MANLRPWQLLGWPSSYFYCSTRPDFGNVLLLLYVFNILLLALTNHDSVLPRMKYV